MATVTIKSSAGAEAGSVDLDAVTFGAQLNVPLLHQVVTAQLAKRRAGTQSTKTRAEVRGGGRKPHRQKGTGGARQRHVAFSEFKKTYLSVLFDIAAEAPSLAAVSSASRSSAIEA